MLSENDPSNETLNEEAASRLAFQKKFPDFKQRLINTISRRSENAPVSQVRTLLQSQDSLYHHVAEFVVALRDDNSSEIRRHGQKICALLGHIESATVNLVVADSRKSNTDDHDLADSEHATEPSLPPCEPWQVEQHIWTALNRLAQLGANGESVARPSAFVRIADLLRAIVAAWEKYSTDQQESLYEPCRALYEASIAFSDEPTVDKPREALGGYLAVVKLSREMERRVS